MTKAEQIALEEFPLGAFPKEVGDSMRLACKRGYLRAEKEYSRLKELADNMYLAAEYLTTDASQLHKAMEEYNHFIVYEYNKKEEKK